MIDRMGVATASASAVLFGASTPMAKLLLGGGLDPWLLAGLLYLGSGLGLGCVIAVRRMIGRPAAEAPLRRADLPWLAGAVLSGGVAGPLLLMLALGAVQGATASLLLNLEGLATMAIAWVVFRENVDRRLLVGAAAIVSGALVLSWNGDAAGGGPAMLLIVGAGAAWGIDNNLTRHVAGGDPVAIAAVKGAVAGTVNTALALALGAQAPAPSVVLLAACIGLLGYGVSLVLFVVALRRLGTARTGAYFSIAPFFGAVLAIPLLAEPLSAQLLVAGALMALGTWLHLAERHDHDHTHEALDHEHRHVHDEHHRHDHGPGDPPGDPHNHPHRHAPMVHRHPHYPDLHHRHGHAHPVT